MKPSLPACLLLGLLCALPSSAFAQGDVIAHLTPMLLGNEVVSILHRVAAPSGPKRVSLTLAKEVLQITYLDDGRLVGIVPRHVTPFDPTTGLELWEIADDGTMTRLGEIAPPGDLNGAQEEVGMATDSQGRLWVLSKIPTSEFPPASYYQLLELDPDTAETLRRVVLPQPIADIVRAKDGLWATLFDGSLQAFDPERGLLFGKKLAQAGGVSDMDSSGALWSFGEGVCSPPCSYLERFDPPTGSIYSPGVLVASGIHDLAIDRRCDETPTTRCLLGGRFRAEVTWTDPQGHRGVGRDAGARSADTAIFYFFEPANWELNVKILDACGLNGAFWVFTAASTNVEYHLTVTDLETGRSRQYDNPAGQVAETVTDTTAFGCPR